MHQGDARGEYMVCFINAIEMHHAANDKLKYHKYQNKMIIKGKFLREFSSE